MRTRKRIGVIMAGGAGERFWPLSRKNLPKQLLDLTGSGKSMLAEAVERLVGICDLRDIYVATSPNLVKPIQDAATGVPELQIAAEPHKRNTAGCLVWFTANLLANDREAINDQMLVVTADHAIRSTQDFQRTVLALLEATDRESALGVIGISPTRPDTGFGYVEAGDQIASITGSTLIWKADRFREKPDAETAQTYVAAGNFFWNSGMFFWTVRTFLEELEAASPVHRNAIDTICKELQNGREDAAQDLFGKLPNVSIDYALMEHSNRVLLARSDFQWDDLGSWDSIDRVISPDANGNSCEGDTLLVRSEGSIVLNRKPGTKVCLMGVSDYIVVAVDDVVLVCPKSEAQSVREIVSEIGQTNPELI